MKQTNFARATTLGLLSGLIAILINTAILAAADWIPLVTARGGLLKLLTLYLSDTFVNLGIYNYWVSLNLPSVNSAIFKNSFHILIGLVMAVFYACILEPRLVGSAWFKGLVYAIAIWVINSIIVLPLIGEGFAGSKSLTLAGMGYFAVAHTTFFVLLAVLYARFDVMRQVD